MADEQGPEIHVRPLIVDNASGPTVPINAELSVVTLLQVEDLHQQFGTLKVLNSISLAVLPGPGAGAWWARRGREDHPDRHRRRQHGLAGDGYRLAGHDATTASPGHRARWGSAHLPGAPAPRLDDRVRDALVAAVRRAGLRRQAAHTARLRRPGPHRPGGQGQRARAPARPAGAQAARLGRALATQPSVLLLDEIAGGLTEPETDALIGTIRAVHEAGTTIVWVEHIMRALTQVVERAVCLADGGCCSTARPAGCWPTPRSSGLTWGARSGERSVRPRPGRRV